MAVPVAAFLWLAVTRRRGAAVLCAALTVAMVVPAYELTRLSRHASDHAHEIFLCPVHSGGADVCPGG